jgi:hypothetical protein
MRAGPSLRFPLILEPSLGTVYYPFGPDLTWEPTEVAIIAKENGTGTDDCARNENFAGKFREVPQPHFPFNLLVASEGYTGNQAEPTSAFLNKDTEPLLRSNRSQSASPIRDNLRLSSKCSKPLIYGRPASSWFPEQIAIQVTFASSRIHRLTSLACSILGAPLNISSRSPAMQIKSKFAARSLNQWNQCER